VKKSVINTDKLEEEERRRLCRNAAMQTASPKKITFLENTATGLLKYYAVNRESGEGNSRSPVMRIFVQAFKCPTEPTIYIFIDHQEEGDIAWIVVEEHQMFPAIEFMSYNLNLVESITEGEYIIGALTLIEL
jgi:hypothetical protein